MSRRSWLANVKSVLQIGAEFYNPLGGKPWDDAQAARGFARPDFGGLAQTKIGATYLRR